MTFLDYLEIPGHGFGTISTPSGTNPSSSTGQTLSFTSSDSSVTITGNSATNTIDLRATGGGTPATVAMAALNADWSLGITFTKTITSSSTFTFSNTVDSKTVQLVIVNTNGSTITMPTATLMGSAPSMTSGITYIYTFLKVGSTFYYTVTSSG